MSKNNCVEERFQKLAPIQNGHPCFKYLGFMQMLMPLIKAACDISIETGKMDEETKSKILINFQKFGQFLNGYIHQHDAALKEIENIRSALRKGQNQLTQNGTSANEMSKQYQEILNQLQKQLTGILSSLQ